MKKRMSISNLMKEDASKILLVDEAESSENEIRFYLNKIQYVTAIDCKDVFGEIKFGERENSEEEVKITSKLLLKSLKEDFIFPFLLSIFTCFSIFLLIILSVFIIKNIYIGLLFIITSLFILFMIVYLQIINHSVSVNLKSKHSAEHMMINFIESNNRLPKNMEEIKNTSRLIIDCGDGISISKKVRYLILLLFALIIGFIAEILISCISENETIEFIVFILFYNLTIIFIEEFEKVNFLITYVQTICSFFIQLGSTTKNVKDEDIMLAYLVARAWMKIIYPEFYNEEEDTFEDEYFKVNTI